MLNDELLTYLFDSQPHRLATQMATWLGASRRFSAFVTAFRTKIRKKIRAAQDPESQLDLRLELETAYVLLQQERFFSITYEPQPSGKLAGPDFAVTYTTSLSFTVEVTRVRSLKDNHRIPGPEEQSAPPPPLPAPLAVEVRLADVVSTKLRQLLPNHANVLLVAMDAPTLTQDDLRSAMLQLQQRVERNDVTVLNRHGFRDRADFFHHFQRLNELLVRGPQLVAGAPVLNWSNPQARASLPTPVRTALYRAFTL